MITNMSMSNKSSSSTIKTVTTYATPSSNSQLILSYPTNVTYDNIAYVEISTNLARVTDVTTLCKHIPDSSRAEICQARIYQKNGTLKWVYMAFYQTTDEFPDISMAVPSIRVENWMDSVARGTSLVLSADSSSYFKSSQYTCTWGYL